ncbi:MAG: hypothetical protein U0793_33725 [Gemmataceae bacterium]
MRHGLSLFLTACILHGLSGCGPSKTDVSGAIKLNGKAPGIKGLQISFLVEGGRIVAAPINADGTYSANDVPVGEAKVAFVYTSPDIPVTKGRLVKPSRGDTPPPKGLARNPVPEHLRDASTSKLSLQIVAGKTNEFNYDIPP